MEGIKFQSGGISKFLVPYLKLRASYLEQENAHFLEQENGNFLVLVGSGNSCVKLQSQLEAPLAIGKSWFLKPRKEPTRKLDNTLSLQGIQHFFLKIHEAPETNKSM